MAPIYKDETWPRPSPNLEFGQIRCSQPQTSGTENFSGAGRFADCPLRDRRSLHGLYDILFEPILQLAAAAHLIPDVAGPPATRVRRGWHRPLPANLVDQPYRYFPLHLTD